MAQAAKKFNPFEPDSEINDYEYQRCCDTDSCDPIPDKALTVFNPFEIEPADFRKSLDRRTENRNTMLAWIKSNLTEGVDYGKIHIGESNKDKPKCKLGKSCTNKYHFSKPSLFKPGAEKICGLLGLRPEYPSIKDYEQRAIAGGKIDVIILRCQLYSGNQIVAEGTGSRLVSKDYGDINKSIKMALKSGQIDATLRCGGLSEIFTQDIEDMNLSGDREEELGQKIDKKAEAKPAATASKPVVSLRNIKYTLSTAKNLLELQSFWIKNKASIAALTEAERAALISYKDGLKQDLTDKMAREESERQPPPVVVKPEPEYLITKDQIDRIKEIVKPGGSGKCLSELEKQKLADLANNRNSLKDDVDKYIESTLLIISQRESETEGD